MFNEEIKNNSHYQVYSEFTTNGLLVFRAHRLSNKRDTQPIIGAGGEIVKLPEFFGEWVIDSKESIDKFNKKLEKERKAKYKKALTPINEEDDILSLCQLSVDELQEQLSLANDGVAFEQEALKNANNIKAEQEVIDAIKVRLDESKKFRNKILKAIKKVEANNDEEQTTHVRDEIARAKEIEWAEALLAKLKEKIGD